MKSKDLAWIATLAICWGLGGFVFGLSIDALTGASWARPCTALNVILGMVMLLLVMRNEQARRIFYAGFCAALIQSTTPVDR